MSSLSSAPALDLSPNVLRESDPDPLRLVLWLPGGEEARCRHWRRVTGHFLGAAALADGLHALPVRVAPFREDFRGEVRRLFDRFWARGQAAARFILPTGAWVEPEGEPRDDALLAWAEDAAAAPGDDRLAELWPGHEACLRLGPAAVLVLGVTPPAPPQPAAVPPPPPKPEEPRPRLTAGVPDAEFAREFRERRRRVKDLIHRGHQEEALAEASALLDLARMRWFDGHPAVGTCLLVLAVVHHGRGEDGLAERLYREVLDIYCPELGDNHPNFATGLNNLALLYQVRGLGADAEPLFRQALDIRLASMGELHALTGASLHNLGLLLHSRGDIIAAESLLLQALHIFRHTFGEAHPDVATCLDSLAAVYQHFGDVGTAGILLGQADQARRAAEGKEHVRVADTLNLLGELKPVRSERAEVPECDAPTTATAGGAGLEADPLAWLTPAATTNLPDDTPAPVGMAAAPDEADALPLLLEEAAAISAPSETSESAEAPTEEVPPAEPAAALPPATESAPETPAVNPDGPGEADVSAAALPEPAAALPPEEAAPAEADASAPEEPFLFLDEDWFADLLEEPQHQEEPAAVPAPLPPTEDPAIAIPDDAPAAEHGPESMEVETGTDDPPATGIAKAPPPPMRGPYPVAIPVLFEAAPPAEVASPAAAEPAPVAEEAASPEQAVEPYPVAVPILAEEALVAPAEEPVAAEVRPAEEPAAETMPDIAVDLPTPEPAPEVPPEDAAEVTDTAAEEPADQGAESEPIPPPLRTEAPPESPEVPNFGCEQPLPDASAFWATDAIPAVPPESFDALLAGMVCATAWAPETTTGAGAAPPDDPTPLPSPPDDPPAGYSECLPSETCDPTSADPEPGTAAECAPPDEVPGEQPAAVEAPPAESLPPDDGACLALAAAGQAAEAIALLQQALAQGNSTAAAGLPPAGEACGLPVDLALFLSLVRQHPAAVPSAAGAALDFVLRHRAAAAEGDRREVARRLPAGSALVEFVRFQPLDLDGLTTGGGPEWLPPRYVAFVLPAGETTDTTLVDLGEAEGIDRLVADARARLVDRPNGERAAPSWRPAGSEGRALRATATLRQMVFDPLTARLGDRARLFLAPTGSLACLPFEVLAHADGRTLLDSHHLSYVGSGLDVLRFGAEPAGEPGPAVVAVDPDFDLFLRPGCRPYPGPDGPPGRFPRLAGTRRPGKQFAALLGVEPWVAAAVRKERLLAVQSPHVLHLGTHCQLTEEGAGLALAGANGPHDGEAAEGDDGLLAAGEIGGLDLEATELVVLSACDAGGGDAARGESFLRLCRAFQDAGAAAVVVSRWKVTDWHARELLADFYQRVLAGEPRSEALCQAQRALKARYPDHPEYWGAFVCHGDPGSVQPRHAPAAAPSRPLWRWARSPRAVARR